jgi:hypothetical protein
MGRAMPPQQDMEEALDLEDQALQSEPGVLQQLPYRGLGFALMNHTRVRAAYFGAHRRVHDLREQMRELELQMLLAERLIHEILLPAWPPLPTPVRPPTLHEAIRIVLEARENGWMHTPQIARQIAKRKLYRRRDGLAASTKDVSARVASYPELFERQGAVVRLRDVPPPSDEYLAALRKGPAR